MYRFYSTNSTLLPGWHMALCGQSWRAQIETWSRQGCSNQSVRRAESKVKLNSPSRSGIVCDGAVTSEVIGQMAKEPKEPKGRSMLARESLVRRSELETNWVTANGHGSGEPSLELGTLIDAKPRTGQAGASAGSVQTPVPGCRPLTDELPGPGPLTCP